MHRGPVRIGKCAMGHAKASPNQIPPRCLITERSLNISMEARCFSFGPFVLIPSRQALLRKGTQVPLGTRALEILSVLVQRPGAVVDKQELMSLVWTDTFVDDSNLKVQIAALRKTLDENASQPSCIATVIGRGYRFVE